MNFIHGNLHMNDLIQKAQSTEIENAKRQVGLEIKLLFYDLII